MPRLVFFTIHRTTPWWKYLGIAHRFRGRQRAERFARRGRLFARRRFLSLHGQGRCDRSRTCTVRRGRLRAMSSFAAGCSEASTALSR